MIYLIAFLLVVIACLLLRLDRVCTVGFDTLIEETKKTGRLLLGFPEARTEALRMQLESIRKALEIDREFNCENKLLIADAESLVRQIEEMEKNTRIK
jgi:hypothetical protein